MGTGKSEGKKQKHCAQRHSKVSESAVQNEKKCFLRGAVPLWLSLTGNLQLKAGKREMRNRGSGQD